MQFYPALGAADTWLRGPLFEKVGNSCVGVRAQYLIRLDLFRHEMEMPLFKFAFPAANTIINLNQ